MNIHHSLVTALTLMTLSNLSETKSQSASIATQNLDSLARRYNIELSKITSPALEERKRVRMAMQRAGYSNVLKDDLDADGFSALVSFIKTKLHIEYSISHRPFVLHIPIQGGEGRTFDLVLHDDWTFPVDPWKKE
jgi:hypothetical protein